MDSWKKKLVFRIRVTKKLCTTLFIFSFPGSFSVSSLRFKVYLFIFLFIIIFFSTVVYNDEGSLDFDKHRISRYFVYGRPLVPSNVPSTL